MLEEMEGKKVEMGVNIKAFLRDEAVKSEYGFRIRCYPSSWITCNEVKYFCGCFGVIARRYPGSRGLIESFADCGLLLGCGSLPVKICTFHVANHKHAT